MNRLDDTELARRELRRIAERELPGARQVADHSWSNGESVVIEFADAGGIGWIGKWNRHRAVHDREVTALRDWAPQLGPGRAPRLRFADDDAMIMITDRLPGTAGTADCPDAYRQAGALTRALHELAPAGVESDHAERLAGEARAWLTEQPDAFGSEDVDFINATIGAISGLPAPRIGSIHNDNQPRNWIIADDGTLGMIDFGRAQIDLYVRDFERMVFAEWRDRPDLSAAFFDGYGRTLSADERALINCRGAYQALGTVVWSRRHGDPDYERHGRDLFGQVRRELTGR
ncbi:phosphotransferase [Microlunatus speluncae]|uniref:phosphotransferase n=1 Tax=Microlunatus speluncae TaxID=2594267 RepID=UPI00126624C8|nr:phosphotransferase [Microlunatus speluncae]